MEMTSSSSWNVNWKFASVCKNSATSLPLSGLIFKVGSSPRVLNGLCEINLNCYTHLTGQPFFSISKEGMHWMERYKVSCDILLVFHWGELERALHYWCQPRIFCLFLSFVHHSVHAYLSSISMICNAHVLCFREPCDIDTTDQARVLDFILCFVIVHSLKLQEKKDCNIEEKGSELVMHRRLQLKGKKGWAKRDQERRATETKE